MLIGIDEAGRGAWAGPFVAVAVLLEDNISDLADSKTLNCRQRDRLAQEIKSKAQDISVAWVTATDIDRFGLTSAQQSAMSRALSGITAPLNARIILDGSINYLKEVPHTEAIIKADATYSAVSAASIVAKVLRDNYMRQLGLCFPEYGFEAHMGYGTAKHRQAIVEYGPIKNIHRHSYKPVNNYA